MLKRIFVLFPVAFLLMASGCTTLISDRGSGSGTGVEIQNFETDFTNVYAGENFKIQMNMRNLGSVDAYDTYAALYNTEIATSGGTLSITCEENDCSHPRLLAPDPQRGTEGASKMCIWECVAPVVSKGVSVDFHPSVRLFYTYLSSVIKSITIASQDEIRNIQNQGTALPSETLSTTSGPISMEVRVKGPIRYWEGESTLFFPVEIEIRNTGGGTPCAQMSTNYRECENTENWNKVILDIWSENPEITWDSCSGIGEDGIVELWKGQEKTVTCEAMMPVYTGYSTGIVQKNLHFIADYSYFKDASTTVTVKGRRTS